MPKTSQETDEAAEHESLLRELASLVSLMQQKEEDAMVACAAASSLFEILQGSPRIRSYLDMPTLVRILPSIMCAHPQHAALQATVCECLCIIGIGSPSNRAHLHCESVLSAVVQAMNSNLDEADVQVAAMVALGEILRDFFVAREIPDSLRKPPQHVVESIVMACVNAMRAHTNKVALNCQAVHVMAISHKLSPSCSDVLLEKDGIAIIFRAVRAFEGNDAAVMLQWATCSILSTMVLQKNENAIHMTLQEGHLGAGSGGLEPSHA
jgi:hypothetical protein